MNIIPPGQAETEMPATHAEIFIRRWQAGDRSCFAKAAGILITTPYPGLRSFRRELARYFCGRETQKQDLKKFFANREGPGSTSSGRMTFVVGGSGSGKSSLTRAGLIAELDSIPLKDQWGAWYVAEMRPQKDPIGQLQVALWNVLRTIINLAYIDPDVDPEPKGDFPERAAAEKAASIRVASAKIRDAALELGMEWPENASRDVVEQAAKHWLDREISPSDGTISNRALFDFVSDVLAEFDAAASYGSRGGKPLLLLHIDQFEEIFRNECKADGRKALIGLLRDIHEYKPECLFAVATMRSEELHRFSEYAGMSEVINSSMYLVDLVAGDDIESAIVEPARRLAKLWELPLDTSTEARLAPYTTEAVKELKDAYREAGEALQHKADKLPLLQHFLPLAWERAADDWIARRERDKAARFEIGTQHLAMVPGWTSGNSNEQICRLGRCLNAAADGVFAKAEEVMAAMAEEQGFKGSQAQLRSEAEGILSVALCCLAQLDDGGQAVRKFVSVDKMMKTSAGAVRLGTTPAAEGHLRTYLNNALQKFDEAGLVELLPSLDDGKQTVDYNVTHESLIRNWAAYKQHLELQKRLEQRLAQLAVQDLPLADTENRSWLDKKLHRDWEAANTLIPSESQETLRLLFGDDSRYSYEWARDVLVEKKRQLVAIGDSSQALAEPEKRIAWIGNLWRDAVKWREWGSKWSSKIQTYAMRGAVVGLFLLAFALTASGVAIMFWRAASSEADKATGLAKQLNLALAVNDIANSTAPRSAVDDRALSWLIDKVKRDYDPDNLDAKQMSILRRTIGNIDKGARAIYGADLTVSFETQQPEGLAENAVCKLVKDSQNARGVNFKVASRFDERQLGDARAIVNTLECGSQDESWFFRLDIKYPEGAEFDPKQRDAFLGLQRLKAPTPLGIRGPRSSESGERMNLMIQNFNFTRNLEAVNPNSVKFIHSGAVIGFLIPRIGPDRDGQPTDVYLWSTTGLADPIPFEPGTGQGQVVRGSKVCTAYKVNHYKSNMADKDPSGGVNGKGLDTRPTYRVCNTGPVNLDTNDKQLVVYRSGYDSRKCLDDLRPCQNTIEIQYRDNGDPEPGDGPAVRTRIVHTGPKIIDAGIQGGWLWIEDIDQRKWQYLVGTEPLTKVLAMRWRNSDEALLQKASGLRYRIPETCKEIPECKEFVKKPDNGWPGVAE